MSYGGQGRGGLRINPRVIIAVLIAIGGIVTYLSQTSVNPTTGKTQHVAMTESQEIRLGLETAPEMASQMGGEVDPDDPRARIVSQVGRRLVERSDARKSPYYGHFEFHLLRDPKTVNAFALPGGQIFITLGLFNMLQNEAQLAGVLGHEMGHVINRHAAEQMAKGQLGESLTTAVAVGASDNQGRGRTAAMAAMLANKMLQLKYGRDDESESDTYGLRYMTQAGYNPEAMLGVMKILKAASNGGGGPEFLQTHPLPQSRFDEIARILQRDYPDREGLSMGRPLHGGTDDDWT